MNLKHYSALAAAFIAMKSKSDAQIVYKDIPDVFLVYNESFALDLNGDGIADFSIKHESFVSVGPFTYYFTDNLAIVPYGNNQVLGKTVFGSYYASALKCLDTISNKGPWNSHANVIERYIFSRSCESQACSSYNDYTRYKGNWQQKQDGYLGLRIINGVDTLYGWVRLGTQNISVIKDYAYQQQMGKAIITGQINCSDIKPQLVPDSTFLCNFICQKYLLGYPNCLAYQWFKNGQPVNDSTFYHFTACDAGNYFVVVSNDSGCVDTSNVATITGKGSNPPPPIIMRDQDTLFSTSAFTYQWENNRIIIPGATNQEFIPQSNSYAYEVSITDSVGCSSISSDFTYGNCAFFPQYLTINDDTIQDDTILLCLENNYELCAEENPEYTYLWFKNGKSARVYTNCISLLSEGEYYCSISQYDATCKTKHVYIENLTKPIVTESGDTLLSSYKNYNQWYLNGQAIPGATSQRYIVQQSGSFSVGVLGFDGCFMQSDSLQIVLTSMNNYSNGYPLIFLIQPRLLQVQFPNEDFLHGKIKILNASGQEIKELEVDKNILQIPFAENETGWFVIDIEKGEHRFYSPMVIF